MGWCMGGAWVPGAGDVVRDTTWIGGWRRRRRGIGELGPGHWEGPGLVGLL